MLFNLREIFDIIVMTLVMGYLFSDFFGKFNQKNSKGSNLFVKKKGEREHEYDPVKAYSSDKKKIGPFVVDWDNMKFAMLIIAPAIILHELGHKFMAMSYGLEAQFYAAYMWLGLALLLRLMGSRFLFIVPAYVSYPATGSIMQSSLIALAGPAVNFALFAIAWFILKTQDKLKPQVKAILILTKNINMFLAIFNMIPIRPFDGGHVFQGIMLMLQGII